MNKIAFVVLAALSLSACASWAPVEVLNVAAPVHAKAEVEAVVDTLEPLIGWDRAGEPEAVLTMASATLERRRFGPPTRRQPDLRLVLATAVDRGRFYPRRRARRRRA